MLYFSEGYLVSSTGCNFLLLSCGTKLCHKVDMISTVPSVAVSSDLRKNENMILMYEIYVLMAFKIRHAYKKRVTSLFRPHHRSSG
jgi:hypothetical protein